MINSDSVFNCAAAAVSREKNSSEAEKAFRKTVGFYGFHSKEFAINEPNSEREYCSLRSCTLSRSIIKTFLGMFNKFQRAMILNG